VNKVALINIDYPIATITFNRPQAMNSFNREMAEALEQITEQIRADNAIRAVLLKGAGNLFMAGGDIHSFHERLATMTTDVMTDIRLLNAAILNLVQMSKPVLASVHGSVAGVGMSFMMAADLVIAADNTKFTMAYGGIGLSSDGGSSYFLPRLVGTKKAMELIMLPDIFDSKTAQEYGLVNWIAPAENLTAETERVLQRLAKGPTHAYAQAKHLIQKSWNNSLETQLDAEGRAFASCCATEDFKIGVTAFLNKKKPEFTGK
jgi:2-(1,2-epoxy-1,2-dihydrophenyl)acetyl-CoA isomerase